MVDMHQIGKPIEILMVEDNPNDVELTVEALKDVKVRNNIHVVDNGEKALDFLRQQGAYTGSPRPDLILLDLNLPLMDGREVLQEIKQDESLRRIPVVVLTVSQAQEDILNVYDLHANCYINKPVDFEKFVQVVKNIENFWLTAVSLPVE